MASPTLDTPYIAAQHAWQERYGPLITQARNWRFAAIVSMLAVVLSLVLATYVAVRNPFRPFPVLIDSYGRTIGGGPAKVLTVEQDELVRRGTMYALIEDLRSVTSDPIAQKRSIDRAYARLKSSSPAHTMLNEHYREHSPFDRSRDELVAVAVNSVLRTATHTWEVEWTETTRDSVGGQMMRRERWRAVLTTTEAPPSSEAAAWVNPLGIYVTNINWAKVEEGQ
jgi:type IV secretion system protein VirB5